MERDSKANRSRARRGPPNGTSPLDRRAALTRLGLMAGAAYVAPSLALLKRGHAVHQPGHGGGGGGGGSPPWSKPTKPSKGSRPYKPSRPSR